MVPRSSAYVDLTVVLAILRNCMAIPHQVKSLNAMWHKCLSLPLGLPINGTRLSQPLVQPDRFMLVGRKICRSLCSMSLKGKAAAIGIAELKPWKEAPPEVT